MHYVYVLYFKQFPVYAGMTNDPIRRYKAHFYENCCRTYNFVRHHAVNNCILPEMRIVYCHPDRDKVAKMEEQAITALAMAGFAILNTNVAYDRNRPQVDSLPVYPDVKRFPHKILTDELFNHIIESKRKSLIEYGKDYRRHINLDYTKSLSGSFRRESSECSQLGSQK